MLEARCPAADLAIRPDGMPAVRCGVMAKHYDTLDTIIDGMPRGVVMTLESDPSCVLKLCCGDADPPATLDEQDKRHHYAHCPIWQFRNLADWAERSEEASLEDLVEGKVDLSKVAGPPPLEFGTPEEERAMGEVAGRAKAASA